jgi:glycosyltransferase involved in cell wall biosynthesis
MRICYIAGIGSLHTQRWVRYFANQGHDVHVITLGSSEVNTVKNVRLYELKSIRPQIRFISYGANLLFYAIQVRKLIREIRPDIIHAHYITLWGFLGMLSGFHPFVLTAWGSDVLTDPKHNPIWRVLTKYALAKADLITCDAEHIIPKMIELGAIKERIYTIYFGIDTRAFNPACRDETKREELDISGWPTIISLRNLKPIYDVESLIRAAPLVVAQVPEVRFIIAGDGEQRDYLKDLAKSLGVSESVRFVGWISNDELPKYLALADIYVSTSLSDAGLASSTAEAMACGLPVVITDFGDNERWVEDGVNGFLISMHDPEALASRIIHLLRNQDDRIRFGQANRKIIEERNNYEREMGKMGKLYEQLIDGYTEY